MLDRNLSKTTEKPSIAAPPLRRVASFSEFARIEEQSDEEDEQVKEEQAATRSKREAKKRLDDVKKRQQERNVRAG